MIRIKKKYTSYFKKYILFFQNLDKNTILYGSINLNIHKKELIIFIHENERK